jgi:hypothetical protein
MDDHYQFQKYLDKNEDDIITLLSERSENLMNMSSPYTILMKKRTSNIYLFVAYSLGRPMNAIWGEIRVGDMTNIKIKFGCSFSSMKIINDMLKFRKNRGFVQVATFSKDRISTRKLGYVIYDSYKSKFGIQTTLYVNGKERNIFLTKKQLEDQIEGHISKGYSLNDSISFLAEDLLGPTNVLSVIMKYNDPIPKHVIEYLGDYLEHNSTLANDKIPKECSLYEDCLITGDDECDLYPIEDSDYDQYISDDEIY